MIFPILLAMGGPNGSGKSTVTSEFKPIGYYVNADLIQTQLNCDPMQAAENAEAAREYLLKNNESFTFESVLSTERNFNLMERAKEKGYKVLCIYVLTYDPQINVDRVASRVKAGGNYVEPEKIVPRYHRAMKLFPKLFTVCDELYVYDNSLDAPSGEPHLILSYKNKVLTKYPNEVWSETMIDSLCNGSYLSE